MARRTLTDQIAPSKRQCVCAVLLNRINDTQSRNQPQQQQQHRTLDPYYLYLGIFVSRLKISINMFSLAALPSKAAVCCSGSSTAKRKWA
jgi:hypothetical protein